MLKILQARLQQYANWEISDIQAGFRKGRGTRDQIANICWIIEKAREFHKNIYFCFIDYTNAFGWFSAIMVSVCLPSDALWQHLPSYLGFSYLGSGISLHCQHQNQIDYILHRQRWRSSIQSTKTRPGPDCGSYHELLIANFGLKLNTVGKNH